MRSALYSRRGFSNQFGKMRYLGSLRLGADTEELVKAEAAKLHMPVIEFVRNYIEQGFHGRTSIEHAQTVRLDSIERVLPKQDRKEPTE
jgi:hypothetical protein